MLAEGSLLTRVCLCSPVLPYHEQLQDQVQVAADRDAATE